METQENINEHENGNKARDIMNTLSRHVSVHMLGNETKDMHGFRSLEMCKTKLIGEQNIWLTSNLLAGTTSWKG